MKHIEAPTDLNGVNMVKEQHPLKQGLKLSCWCGGVNELIG